MIHTLAIDTKSTIGVFAENPGPYRPDKVTKKHFKETCGNCKVLLEQVNHELTQHNPEGSFIDHFIEMKGVSLTNYCIVPIITYLLARGEYIREEEDKAERNGKGEKAFDQAFTKGWCQNQRDYHRLEGKGFRIALLDQLHQLTLCQ